MHFNHKSTSFTHRFHFRSSFGPGAYSHQPHNLSENLAARANDMFTLPTTPNLILEASKPTRLLGNVFVETARINSPLVFLENTPLVLARSFLHWSKVEQNFNFNQIKENIKITHPEKVIRFEGAFRHKQSMFTFLYLWFICVFTSEYRPLM